MQKSVEAWIDWFILRWSWTSADYSTWPSPRHFLGNKWRIRSATPISRPSSGSISTSRKRSGHHRSRRLCTNPSSFKCTCSRNWTLSSPCGTSPNSPIWDFCGARFRIYLKFSKTQKLEMLPFRIYIKAWHISSTTWSRPFPHIPKAQSKNPTSCFSIPSRYSPRKAGKRYQKTNRSLENIFSDKPRDWQRKSRIWMTRWRFCWNCWPFKVEIKIIKKEGQENKRSRKSFLGNPMGRKVKMVGNKHLE